MGRATFEFIFWCSPVSSTSEMVGEWYWIWDTSKCVCVRVSSHFESFKIRSRALRPCRRCIVGNNNLVADFLLLIYWHIHVTSMWLGVWSRKVKHSPCHRTNFHIPISLAFLNISFSCMCSWFPSTTWYYSITLPGLLLHVLWLLSLKFTNACSEETMPKSCTTLVLVELVDAFFGLRHLQVMWPNSPKIRHSSLHVLFFPIIFLVILQWTNLIFLSCVLCWAIVMCLTTLCSIQECHFMTLTGVKS